MQQLVHNNESQTHLVHANILLFLAPPAFTLHGAASSPAGGAGKHPVLEAQIQIAHTLEHTAQLECPGDGVRTAKEVAHLHSVTNNPCSENRYSEALAGARAVVGQDLREGKSSLDRKTDSAQEANIGCGIGDRGEVEDGQDGNEVSEEEPVPRNVPGQILRMRHSCESRETHGLVFFHCQKS